jgi:hypothetical protein
MFEATSTENWNLIKLYHVFSISFFIFFADVVVAAAATGDVFVLPSLTRSFANHWHTHTFVHTVNHTKQ